MTNKTESGTNVDFNCPRSHEKEEVPFHRPPLFPSSSPPPPCLTGQSSIAGSCKGNSATRLCDSPGARPGEGNMGVSVQPLPSPIGAPALTLLLFPVGCLPDHSDNHTPHVPTSHFPPARCGGGGDGDQTIEIQYPSGFLLSSYPAATSSLTVQRAILGNEVAIMTLSTLALRAPPWRGVAVCLALGAWVCEAILVRACVE